MLSEHSAAALHVLSAVSLFVSITLSLSSVHFNIYLYFYTIHKLVLFLSALWMIKQMNEWFNLNNKTKTKKNPMKT